MIPNIARQLKKESHYKETPLQNVIEDLEFSSDFVLHSTCLKYPVCYLANFY